MIFSTRQDFLLYDKILIPSQANLENIRQHTLSYLWSITYEGEMLYMPRTAKNIYKRKDGRWEA